MRTMNTVGAALLLGFWCNAGMATVPNPTVIGPIPATAVPGDPSHNYPFYSTTVDLAAYDYVEEEFFLQGTANQYNLGTGSIIDSGHYTTRIVVRRPASPVDFNGTVLIEWQNIRFGWDVDAFWLASHDHFIRRGYAWVGVSAQQAGIDNPLTGLKAWNPIRYQTLDVTQRGKFVKDELSFDIFSQAAQAVRSPVGVDPMGGLNVERVLAIGASASAARLVMYHNSIHPLAGVLDAFLVGEGGGSLRTDLDVKVIKFLTETEIAGLSGTDQVPIRQPDSDHFRRWEVAGTSHIDFHFWQEFAPLVIRDLGSSQLPEPLCLRPSFSRIPGYFVLNAATEQLVRWVKDNIPPPSATQIEVASRGPPNIIARDSFGNALGGIRLSQLAVPTATNTGVNSPPPYCSLFGSFQPFDAATLAEQYRNHGTYVSQVTHATHDNLKDGFIVLEDEMTTVQEAAQSDIGKR